MNKKTMLVLIPFLAFIIPLLYRFFLELYALPHTIGYDVYVYYVPYLVGFYTPSPIELYSYAPLYYILSGAIQSLLNDPILSIKIIIVVLQGALGLSLFLWASTIMKMNRALLFSIVASLYIASLRISWDLHRNVLSLIMMLMAFYALDTLRGKRRLLIATGFGVLAALANPICPPILAVMLLPKIIQKEKASIVVLSSTIIVWVSILLASTIALSSYTDFSSVVTANGLFHIFSVSSSDIEFLIYVLLPLLPLLIYPITRLLKDRIYFKRILPPILWLIFCIVAAFFVSPSFRFAILAPIPVILLIVLIGGKKTQILLTCVVVTLAIGYTVYNTTDPFTYFASPVMWRQDFLSMIPSSMLQNTLPLEDTSIVQGLFQGLVDKVVNNNTLVYTPGPMLSHALLSGIPKEKILWTDIVAFNSSSIKEQVDNGNVVYIVWWKIGYQWYGINIEKVLENLDYSIIETRNSYAIYYIHGIIS